MLSLNKKVDINKKKININPNNPNNPIHARILENLRVIEISKFKQEELRHKGKNSR